MKMKCMSCFHKISLLNRKSTQILNQTTTLGLNKPLGGLENLSSVTKVKGPKNRNPSPPVRKRIGNFLRKTIIEWYI